MLWAAFGINRPDGKRTAPSAKNQQQIDIYVATGRVLYLYDAKASILKGENKQGALMTAAYSFYKSRTFLPVIVDLES